jgi:hypothetical protein
VPSTARRQASQLSLSSVGWLMLWRRDRLTSDYRPFAQQADEGAHLSRTDAKANGYHRRHVANKTNRIAIVHAIHIAQKALSLISGSSSGLSSSVPLFLSSSVVTINHTCSEINCGQQLYFGCFGHAPIPKS